MSLQRFDCNGIELVIDTVTGESFTTQAGYVRMSGRTQPTISIRMKKLEEKKDINKVGLKTAQVLTPGGLQEVKLIPGEIAFSWLVDDNPELAKVMGNLGWQIYCHKLAGFTVTSNIAGAKKPKPIDADAMKQIEDSFATLKNLIIGGQSIFTLINQQLSTIESNLEKVTEVEQSTDFDLTEDEIEVLKQLCQTNKIASKAYEQLILKLS